eukprot:CAMPEP_0113634206 /NCGR_PEP_ID=MMETSP0017_2-20120614/17809_1 /TAXON_ID=2856 /ORGANISM="Cylindrotheca closterium" /LENGTH=49 /DNA_ID=CAMNT_0000544891 /DNA_START=125 /DNA_END=274 /DNA_ORIENTATION=+ /assembly_acc=CAM_ASM_000147
MTANDKFACGITSEIQTSQFCTLLTVGSYRSVEARVVEIPKVLWFDHKG